MNIMQAPKNPSDELFARTKDFLRIHEKKCVSLLDRILHHEVRSFLVLDGGKIKAVFSYSDGGQILHCFSDIALNHYPYSLLLTDFFSHFSALPEFEKLFSIIGEESGTNLLQGAIFSATGQEPLFQEESYFFELSDFAREFQFAPISKPYPTMRIERAGMELFDALKPIQRAYEEEEVLGGEHTFNPAVSNFLLKKALMANAVFIAQENGSIVGKAALNAQGENYVQIGGVFTAPDFRRHGIARALVEKIIAEKKAQGKKIVLFAKKKNLPAQKLYETCGFEKFGNFKICYYRKD